MSKDRLNLKILPAHREALEEIADADKEAVAVIVRRLIKTEAERRGFWPRETRECN